MGVLRSLILIAVLVTGVAASSAVAQENTPEPSPATSPVVVEEPFEPLALYDALLRAPFDQKYWPSDATKANASPWVNGGDSTLDATVAAVQITFEGSSSAGLAFAIYPSAVEARESLGRAATQTGGVATPVATPAATGDPTVVLDYGSFKVCLIQVNNVLIDGAGLDEQTAVAMARAGVEHLNNVAAVVPSGAATPEASSAAFGSITPVLLNQRLVVAQFAASGIPSALSNPQVTAWTDTSDTDLVGTVGAAYVTFTGGDGAIAYLIFPNSTIAEQRVIENAAQARAQGADIADRANLGYPAEVTVNGTDVICVLRVDFVLVAGSTTIVDGQTDTAVNEAIALAKAGAEHIVTIAKAT